VEPADLFEAMVDAEDTGIGLTLNAYIVYPKITFHAIAITPLKIVSTPLSNDLFGYVGGFQSGMITLD
jgi:hypothetical protein